MQQLHTSLARLRTTVTSGSACLLFSLLLVMSVGISRAQTPGGALSFGGVSEYIEVPDAASLDISATVTVEMWLQTTTAANAVLLEKSNNNTNYGLQLNAGKLLFLVSPNAATGQLMSNGTVNDGQWHHVAGTYNQATHTMNVYIDGIVDNTSATITDAITPNTQTLLIGSRSGTLAFAGQMDEIRIWSRELCAGEIQNNKNCEVTTSQNGLVAVYHLDEGIAGGNNAGTTVPGAPSITSVTSGNAQVIVQFAPPASDGGSPITSYTVISTPGNLQATGAGSPLTVTRLTNGQPYTVKIKCTNAVGTGVLSGASASVTPKGPPGAPTVGAVSQSGLLGDRASVAFTAPSNTGGSAITGYIVTSTPGGFTGTGTVTPIVVTGLTPTVSYKFFVNAINAIGTSANSVLSANFIPTGRPSAPVISGVAVGDGSLTVSFSTPANNGAPITSYTAIAQPGGTIMTLSGATAAPITIPGLTNGQSYTITVTATNSRSVSAPSVPSDPAIPAGLPSAPAITGATATDGQATVSFTAPANNGGLPISNYTVTSSPDGITASGSSSPVTVTGLTDGTAYTFNVVATNAIGTGTASASSAQVTPTGVPGAPAITSVASSASGNAPVSCTPPASTGGIAITQYTVTSIPDGITASGTTSPITVTGLTNGQSYTFTATATNAVGTSAASAPSSNGITPVGAPTPPTITSVVSGDSYAIVTFTAPSNNGGEPITAYTVTSSPGNFTATGSSLSLGVPGLTNGQTYTFTASATNAIGTSPASAPSQLIEPTGVPTAPAITGVNVTGSGSVQVAFSAPANTGGLQIISYTVTSIPGGFNATGSSYQLNYNTLVNGVSYTFSVYATNSLGNSPSSASSSTPVTPTGVPGAPTIFGVTPSNGAASVSFTAPSSNGGLPITGYTVTSSPGGFTGSGSTSPVTVSGLTDGVSYTFTMVAANSAGSSPASAPSSSVTPFTVPGAPAINSVTGGNGQATVAFTAPAGNGGSPITGYTVTSSPGGFTASGSISPVVVTGLANGTPYTFTAVAVNAAGSSAASAASAAVTPATVPSAPSAVTARASFGAVMVSFTAPASNGGALVTSYTVSTTTGITATGTNSPIWVMGLTNGVAYTVSVVATNAVGNSVPSSSASATPAASITSAKLTISSASYITGGKISVAFTGKPVSASSVTVFDSATGAFTVPGGQSMSGTTSPLVISGVPFSQTYTVTAYYTVAAGVSLPTVFGTTVTTLSE